MNFINWVRDDFHVSIKHYDDLERLVDENGYVNRGFGISEGAYELFGQAAPTEDPIDAGKRLVEEFEVESLDALNFFLEDVEDTSLYDLGIEQYYPMAVVEDDQGYVFCICVNQRVSSPGVLERFTCVITMEESKVYAIERGKE